MSASATHGLSYPPDFVMKEISTGAAMIYVRTAGVGPAVLLLHGYGETGDMWVPMAVDLSKDHLVIVPDLRGLGLSSKPASGYEKKAQAEDMARILDALDVKSADVVAHDIGNMVAFALAAKYPDRVTKLAVIDAPVPGVGPWEEVLKNPLLWHFRFGGPDMERLVAGRERIYLDRFWNEFSATPARFSEAAREHYAALYALPGAMHAGFSQFAAFDQDAIDNRKFLATAKLQHAHPRGRRREVFRAHDGDSDAVCRIRRARGDCSGFWPLDHGRESPGDHQDNQRFFAAIAH